MTHTIIPFRDRLAKLCSAELEAAKSDPERISDMLESLLNSTAFTIAIFGKGNIALMNELSEGAEGYLFERAVDLAKVGKLIDGIAP